MKKIFNIIEILNDLKDLEKKIYLDSPEVFVDFADRIAEVTGYKTDGNFEKLDAAGYKDWALQSMKIPSLTVEIGKPDSPLPWWCFEEIYRENRRVWEEMLLDLEKENSPRTGKYGG